MNRHHLLAFVCCYFAVAAWAPAQEHQHDTAGERKPATMLPATMSSILLMEGREDLEQPSKTLDYMELSDGDLVADIGCGNGFYSLRAAKRIGPHGAVFAVDVQQGMLDQLQERMTAAEIRNVYPILGEFTDPNLPPGKIDWVLLVDAYHEFSDPQAMLAKIKACLAPNGKVALLEYRAEQEDLGSPIKIPRDHMMTVDEVMREWVPAGFELVELAEFLPAQHLFVFEASRITLQNVGSTKRVSTYNNKVYFAGQPAKDDMKTFADMGVKTVINLRTPPEVEALDFDEKAAVVSAGMTYVNVPMGKQFMPLPELEELFATIDTARESGPVLIHCASSNRVGAVWGAYRGLKQGLSADDAVAEGKAAGLRAQAFDEAIRELMGDR